jgi:hypothetical protein
MPLKQGVPTFFSTSPSPAGFSESTLGSSHWPPAWRKLIGSGVWGSREGEKKSLEDMAVKTYFHFSRFNFSQPLDRADNCRLGTPKRELWDAHERKDPYPVKPGCCSSLSSPPGTGFSGQSPDATTRPCWRAQPHPRMSQTPVRTNPLLTRPTFFNGRLGKKVTLVAQQVILKTSQNSKYFKSVICVNFF